MGLFDNLFGKKNCALCGAECGPMQRDRIRNKEYVCSDCTGKCSANVRLSEMDKDAVREHIAFMEHREKIYQEKFTGVSLYPGTPQEFAVKFSRNAGMLAIIDKKNHGNKVGHEVIRFDEIASYRYYKEMNKPEPEGGQETFREDGIILRLVQDRSMTDEMARMGLRPHPYIKREIRLRFRTSEKETNDADNAIALLDGVFGKAQQPAAEAQTDGLSVYSRRADEAENSITD